MSDPVADNAGTRFDECGNLTTSTAIIGADVGGTYARLGWATLRPGDPIQVNGFRKYTCAEHPSLAAILRDYVHWLHTENLAPTIQSAVVAIAGVLDGDDLLNTNLAWPVSLSRTRRDAGLEQLALINDFVAVAQALPYADAAAMQRIYGEDAQAMRLPALVLGPGTGLGVALRLADGVLSSEAGHAALSAGTPLEQDVLRLLSQQHAHVDNERILSGPGLVALYTCLCELRAAPAQWQTPAQIIQAARAETDPLALESTQMFAAWLGSLAGDLALTFGARSVYLTGGITGHLAAELHGDGFQQRFLSKGGLSPALRQVPVWRIEHGELGVLGALAWHAENALSAAARRSATEHGE
jgi:glucokinase